MEVVFTRNAKSDLLYWEKNNKTIFEKINLLIANIIQTPYSGIGKPEALRFNLSGYWSRRINREHRLVYRVHRETVYILQCRLHYK